MPTGYAALARRLETLSAQEVTRAVRMTFLALTFLYLGAITILVGIMPWNRAGVTESPFVTVFRSVNIALVNELKLLCLRMDINILKIEEAVDYLLLGRGDGVATLFVSLGCDGSHRSTPPP